jgi:DNA-directed RNA polymerase subunit M/transcription elongation factor TFIIS
MQFCPICEALLIPRRGSTELFCRICNKTFKAVDGQADYKMKSKIEKDRVRSKTAVVESRSHTQSISEDERRAFEDYFTDGEQ